MKLTPLDVRKQEFRKTLRGFDPIEVQTFLEMVAEEYESVLEQNKQLHRKLIELETKLSNYQENEKNLRETLLNVQEVKKQSEESSRRQAGLVVKEAELKALEIIENARKQARQMRDEVSILQTQKESFINRLRQILISQIELLSVLEIDEAIPEEAQEYVENVRRHKQKKIQKALKKEEKSGTGPSSDTDSQPAQIHLADEEETPLAETAAVSESSPEVSEEIIQESDQKTAEGDEKTGADKKKAGKKATADDEINDFFKRGIQIDDLIKNLDKSQQK